MLNPAIRRYWLQYKWSNMFAMVKNMKEEPKRCAERYRQAGGDYGGYLRRRLSYSAQVRFHGRAPPYDQPESGKVRARLQGNRRRLWRCERVSSPPTCRSWPDIQRVGRHLAALDTPIDVLIHNAGLHLTTRTETPDGFEVNFALHYLAPFIITSMLMPKLARDRTGRIIFVGSEAYRFAVWGLSLDDLQWERRRYAGIKAYGAGKLAQLLSMHLFASELGPCSVTINAMHPGMVRTERARTTAGSTSGTKQISSTRTPRQPRYRPKRSITSGHRPRWHT